jgi:hypothetical protein
VVIATGRLLQVDPVLLVCADIGITELERDPECSGCRERGVGVERVTELVLLQAIRQLCGSVRADCDDGKSELGELGLDLAQLTELRGAVGSPAAAIENE